MSYYQTHMLPPKVQGTDMEITNEIIVRGTPVYDSIMGLSSNFTNLATNITGTDMNLSGNANITGFITCNRVSVGNLVPSSSSHLTSKSYVDGLITTASGNLTKTGNNIAMNSSISLTGVTLTGAFVGTTGSFSGAVTTGAISGTTGNFSGNIASIAPSSGSHLTNKSYVDGLISTASGNLTKTGLDITLNPSISLTGITLTGAFVGTTGNFSGAVTTGALSATTGAFSSTLSGTSFTGNLIGGTVSGTTGNFSGAVTTGALSATTGAFSSTLSGTSFTGNLIGGTISGTTGNFSGAVTTGALSATTGTFSSTLSGTSFTGNLIGGTVSGTTGSFSGAVTTGALSATTGTLSGILTVNNTTAAASSSVAALVIAGGLGVGSGLVVTGTGNFSGSCAVGSAVSGSHATQKTYVDGISYITAGTGLTKSSSTLSVNASQTQITSIGTLGSLAVTGNITCADPSTSVMVATKNYVDTTVNSALVNGFLFFVTTTHNGVTLSYTTQKSYWHKIGLNLVCVQLALQGITAASPSAADSTYTLTLPGGMPVISNIINGQKPSLDVRIVGDTLPNNYSWIAIPSISPQKIVISQVDRAGALQNFPIAAGARDIFLQLFYQCD